MLAVDRDGHQRAEIGAAGEIALAHLATEPAGLRDRVVAVLVRDAVLADDDLGIDARRVDVADHLEDLADRSARGRRPAGDGGRDHVVRLRVALLAWRDLDVHDQPAVEGDDEARAGAVGLEAADDRRRATFEDAKDAPFGALVGHALDPRDDAVAVHRLIEVAARDVDVAGHPLHGPIGHDESEPARVGGDAPDDQVHPVRQAVAVAPRLDQLALADQVLEQPFERRALLPRYLQPLQELARRGRVLDLVANQLQQLFVIQHVFILVLEPVSSGVRP